MTPPPSRPYRAELYNPATGTSARTGSMTTPRENQTATLLNNGEVLVAGGQNGTGSTVTSAELYNPATGRWALTGSMSTAREGQGATLLPDGDVLVTAGLGGISGLFSELYHPATGRWSAATGGLNACTSASECRTNTRAMLRRRPGPSRRRAHRRQFQPGQHQLGHPLQPGHQCGLARRQGQMALFTAGTRFIVCRDPTAAEPTQQLNGRESLAPVFDNLNTYLWTVESGHPGDAQT